MADRDLGWPTSRWTSAALSGEACAESSAEAGTPEASSADEVGEENPGEDDDSCPLQGGKSFAAGTPVVLASGKAIAISHLKVGDKVLASDIRPGKDQPETVTAVLVHHDTDLYNLKVKTSHDTEVIRTTSNHLFWAPSLKKWTRAAKLYKGEALITPGGTATAYADGGYVPAQRVGWMWDLTVPGNNDHDFYVAAGSIAVLVHNADGDQCCGPYHRRPGPQTSEEMAAARNGETTELRGGINRGSSFRSVDAHYGSLPAHQHSRHVIRWSRFGATGEKLISSIHRMEP